MKKTIFALAFVVASPASAQDWTGAYAGLSYGAGSAGFFNFSDSAEGNFTDDAVYGLFAGYTFQRNRIVYGAELAYQRSEMTNTLFPNEGLDRLVDLKFRVGMTAGRSLVYSVLGYSTNRVYSDDFVSDGDGAAFGLGFDYQLKENFILGAEYLHREMRNEPQFPVPLLDVDASTFSIRASMTF